MNAKGARFVGWYNLEVFAIPLRACDAFYCPVKDVCKNDKGSRTLGVPTSIVFSLFTNKVQSGSPPIRDFLQKVLEDEFDMMTLSAFVRCVRYGSSKHLTYLSMIAGCADYGVLLRVDLSTIKSWYKLGLLRLNQEMEMDPLLALVAVGHLMDVGWDAWGNQKWFLFKYAEGETVVLPCKPPMIRRNFRGVEVQEGGELVVKPKY